MISSSRNAWCDCIRGYAILLVCISHFFDLEPTGSWGKVIWYYFKGDTGVFMFYVLSGFLVTGLLEREITKPTRTVSNGHILRNFFLRRIFRSQLRGSDQLARYGRARPNPGAAGTNSERYCLYLWQYCTYSNVVSSCLLHGVRPHVFIKYLCFIGCFAMFGARVYLPTNVVEMTE